MEVIFALLPSSQKLMQEKADSDRQERYRMRAERVLMTMTKPTPLPAAAPLPPPPLTPPRRMSAAAIPPSEVEILVASIEDRLSPGGAAA